MVGILFPGYLSVVSIVPRTKCPHVGLRPFAEQTPVSKAGKKEKRWGRRDKGGTKGTFSSTSFLPPWTTPSPGPSTLRTVLPSSVRYGPKVPSSDVPGPPVDGTDEVPRSPETTGDVSTTRPYGSSRRPLTLPPQVSVGVLAVCPLYSPSKHRDLYSFPGGRWYPTGGPSPPSTTESSYSGRQRKKPVRGVCV